MVNPCQAQDFSKKIIQVRFNGHVPHRIRALRLCPHGQGGGKQKKRKTMRGGRRGRVQQCVLESCFLIPSVLLR